MPVWLFGLILKYGPTLLKFLYPLILKFILKPMSPEDQEKWNEIHRQGGSKEDIMEFQKNRRTQSPNKVPSGTTIIKENKPKPKLPIGTKDKE